MNETAKLEVIQRTPERSSRLPVVATESPTMLSILSQVVTGPNANIEIVERMVALYNQQEDRAREHEKSERAEEARRAFNSAMAACQAEMEPVAKDASNDTTHSRYASYDAIDRALRPIYTKHGFALMFGETDSPKPEHLRITVEVAHKDGGSRSSYTDVDVSGKGAKGGDVMTKTHAIGSGKSYGQRYLTKAVFNVAVGEEDDDGNGAGDPVTIGPGQLAAVNKLIDDLKGDREKLLKDFKIAKFEDILAVNFDAACEEIKRWAAMDTAHKMRALMASDLEESVVAKNVLAENNRLNDEHRDLLEKAWGILSTKERASWKAWLDHGKKANGRK